MGFLIFGGFGEEGDAYKPEVLVVISNDAEFHLLARAKWSGDWPEVLDWDAIPGEVTFAGTVAGVQSGSLTISDTQEVQNTGVPIDEVIDVVNKLSIKLRFG